MLAEILFPPLTGIGVESNRCEGSVIVVDVRLSVNFNSLSIEESIAKLQRSNLQLIDLILGDLRFANASKPALAQLESLKLEHTRRPPASFNEIDVFRCATQAVLDAQQEAFSALAAASAWEGEKGDDVATRARMLAELCARAGNHEAANQLLRISLQKRPLDAQHAELVTTALAAVLPPVPASIVWIFEVTLLVLISYIRFIRYIRYIRYVRYVH